MEYLMSFYDRNCHIFDGDRYRNGRDELHIHFRSVGSFCAVFRADHVGRGERAPVHDTTNCGSGTISNGCKRPVFVWVRDLLEIPSPIASTVRLQRLDTCFMAGVEAFQSELCPALEILWS